MRSSSLPLRAVILGIAGACVALASACDNPVYERENRPLEAVVQPPPPGQMTDPGALLSDTDLYVLPIRQPTKSEQAALDAEQMKLGLPMPVPWVGLRDVELEIDWTLKNLESTDIMARVTINGGNEFGDYDKTLFVDAMAPVADQTGPPDLLGGGELLPLAAGALRQGVFREDQLHEVGIDLEAITRYPPPNGGINTPFMVLTRLSTSSTVGLQGVPVGDITPAMVRFQVLLEATGHATLDYTIRVREIGSPGDKLAVPGADNLYVSTNASLPAPAVPMQPTTPAG